MAKAGSAQRIQTKIYRQRFSVRKEHHIETHVQSNTDVIAESHTHWIDKDYDGPAGFAVLVK